jgi:hypothetical protein
MKLSAVELIHAVRDPVTSDNWSRFPTMHGKYDIELVPEGIRITRDDKAIIVPLTNVKYFVGEKRGPGRPPKDAA